MTKPIVTIYGEPGIGKTTFGDSAPGRIFLACERGAKLVQNPRVPEGGYCRTWKEFLSSLGKIADGKHAADWLVIDTISNVENLLAAEICEKEFNGVWLSGAGEQGFNAYGRGAKRVAQEFRQILPYLEKINESCGMGIVLLSHVGTHRASNLFGADYQKLAPRMDRASWSVLEEYVDVVGYAGTEIRSSTRSGETKAKASLVGETRWIWFGQHPARVSKDRAGFVLPEKILLDWGDFEKALGTDPLKDLAEETLALYANATPEDRSIIDEKMENDVTALTLEGLGKRKLESLINWLKSHEKHGDS